MFSEPCLSFLSFFLLPLHGLSFFDLRPLITHFLTFLAGYFLCFGYVLGEWNNMPRNIVDQFGALISWQNMTSCQFRQRIVKFLDFFATWNTQMWKHISLELDFEIAAVFYLKMLNWLEMLCLHNSIRWLM